MFKPFEHLYQYLKRTDVRLFDIIKRIELELKELWKRGFTSSGDLTGYTFNSEDFVIDGNIHTLDLSPFIPEGTKLILFSVIAVPDVVPAQIIFRKAGNTHVYNASVLSFIASTLYTESFDFFVECDSARKIEYWAMAGVNWSTLNVTIRGWWT